ncbi:MAG: HesA/MoeB/ThiF family protein [Lactobacillus sp.]|jgi:adenylyltransferase/sulfurtransferase|nr:HesA/MoeB/ThiF family protein [Lactobacillus sp.]
MTLQTSTNQVNRYDRQMRVKQIGASGQRKINHAHILIIGAGALGSYCAELLARAGIGQLTIFDPDVVSLTNLQRQTLFTEADAAAGVFKVDAVKTSLAQINHTVTVTTYPYELSESRFQKVAPFDLAIDCTDNYGVRDLLNQLALKYKFDYIFGSCAGVSGNVMAISPTTHPCLHCLYPNLEALKQTDCDLLGVNTALIPLVSGLQVSLALKYLVNKELVDFDRLITIDNWQMSQQSFKVTKDPHCPACGQPLTHISADFDNQLKTLCGTNVYAIYLDNSLSLAEMTDRLDQHQIKNEANAISVQFPFEKLQLTYFKNHKLFIYDAPDKATANRGYEQLLNQLQIKKAGAAHA